MSVAWLARTLGSGLLVSMRSPLTLLAIVVLLPVIAAQESLVVPLADRYPELTNLSSWAQHLTVTATGFGKSARGVFPVGNGTIFGYFGLADHAATVQGLCGPTYETDEAWAPQGHFGEQSLALFANGEELSLPVQTVARVRGANLVVTEDRNEAGVALVTLNFAMAGDDRLYRVVEVRNGSKGPLRGVELRARVAGAGAGVEAVGTDGLRVRSSSAARPYVALFRFVADGFVQDGELVRPCGELPAGASVRTACEMHAWRAGNTMLWGDPTLAFVENRVGDCVQWWRNRLAGTASFVSDPPRAADLIEDWKVLLLVQRSATNGLFAGMVNQRVCRVRDLAGPMLLCLRYNLWGDAKAMLQAVWRATNQYGALREELPLDVSFVEVDPAVAKWDAVAIPEGSLGSLVILLHEWYWRASGDTELVRAHLPMLQRCLDGQRFTPEGLQSFSGSEAHLVLDRLLDDRLATENALLAHDPSAYRSALSLDAGALFVMANMAMGELHDALAPAPAATPAITGPEPAKAATTHIDPVYLRRTIEVARLVESRYWQPTLDRFAPALSPLGLAAHTAPLADDNLRLQWLGWTFASSEKNRRNLRSTLESLWRAPDAVRVGMTSGTGYSSGETQPLLLYALADLDDLARDGAMDELLRMAGPAGEWGALYDPLGRPAWSRVPQWPERCLPGPSGLAIDAICFALSGIRYAAVPSWDDEQQARFRPRLPPATKSFEFRDIRRDGRHLQLRMQQVMAKLSAEEVERQEKLLVAKMIEAKDVLDPAVEHARFRYQVVMENPPPDDKHIVCSVNLGRDTRMRYLAQSLPAFGDSVDPPIDPQHAYPRSEEVAEPVASASSAAAPFATLLFTARADADRRYRIADLRTVDVGLPLGPEAIAGMLIADGKALGKRLIFDVDVQGGGAQIGKGTEFWRQAILRQAIAAFEAAGGEVITPRFFSAWQVAAPWSVRADQPFAVEGPALQANNWPGEAETQVAWHPVDADASGTVDLGVGGASMVACVRTAVAWIDAAAPVRCVLRAGSREALQVWLDGKVVLAQAGAGRTAADQFEANLELTAGAHRLAVVVADTGGASGFRLRIVGSDGLPVAGLTARRP